MVVGVLEEAEGVADVGKECKVGTPSVAYVQTSIDLGEVFGEIVKNLNERRLPYRFVVGKSQIVRQIGVESTMQTSIDAPTPAGGGIATANARCQVVELHILRWEKVVFVVAQVAYLRCN